MNGVSPQIPKAIRVLKLFDAGKEWGDPPPQESDKWICLKDRPPNVSKYMLCWAKYDYVIIKAYYYRIPFFNKFFWIDAIREEFLPDPRHYLPLEKH